MKMATENLKGEQQRRLEARKNYIEQRLNPLEDLNSMNECISISNIDRRWKIHRTEICLCLSSSRIEITLPRFTQTITNNRRKSLRFGIQDS